MNSLELRIFFSKHNSLGFWKKGEQKLTWDIQLFRERLSEKLHETMPKGIVGDFEFKEFEV